MLPSPAQDYLQVMQQPVSPAATSNPKLSEDDIDDHAFEFRDAENVEVDDQRMSLEEDPGSVLASIRSSIDSLVLTPSAEHRPPSMVIGKLCDHSCVCTMVVRAFWHGFKGAFILRCAASRQHLNSYVKPGTDSALHDLIDGNIQTVQQFKFRSWFAGAK